MTWNDALTVARQYHHKKTQSRHGLGVDYDENGTEYSAMPNIVKDALDYLCESGEIQ